MEGQLAVLGTENDLLRAKLGPAAWRIDANGAEAFIHGLVGGIRTTGSAPYDILAENGQKVEIKFSSLNTPRGASSMRRWVWAHILGRADTKEFDQLILVAPQDPKFQKQSMDPRSPWIVFAVPAAEVRPLIEADGTIWTGTHPTKFRRKTHERLIREFQTTRDELASCYRNTH